MADPKGEGKVYSEKIAFHCRKSVKTALEKHAESIGLTPSIICRQVIIEYLQLKGFLLDGKNHY